MSKNNGGSAFPMIRDMRHNADWDHEAGMSLRDYFAAQAMLGIVSTDGPQRAIDMGVSYADNERGVAEQAYAYADAMLAAREE